MFLNGVYMFNYPPYVIMEGYIILVLFFLCPVTDISATTVAPIGAKFCMMVHICLGQIFSHLRGAVPPGIPKSEIWA